MNYKIIIPARKGSKRFPSKNTINFIDKPLISHTIDFALKTFNREDIWINTDDEKIFQIAKDYNVNLTIRPTHLATDYTSTADVLHYQSKELHQLKIEYDAMILLQPTNPLRPENMLNDAIKLYENKNKGSLAAFSKNTKKLGQILNDKFIPLNYSPGQRSQDILSNYFETGLIYITKLENINKKIIMSDDVIPYIYDGIESLVDIDEPFDLDFAEFIYKHLNNIK